MMEENMKVNGQMETCMDLDNIFGLMEDIILGITEMIKNKVMEYINLKISENILDGGFKANSMDLVFIKFLNVF